jgi:site-specific recombinase XerD
MTIVEGHPDFSPSAQLVEEYFLFKPHLTEGSKRNLSTVLRLFHEFVGNKDWKSVTAKDLMQFLSQYKRQRSRSSRFYIIRGFLSWLNDDELPRDLAKLKIPEPNEVVVTFEDLLTNNEVADLRDACQTLRDKVIVMMLWGTGMRVNELLQLRMKMR